MEIATYLVLLGFALLGWGMCFKEHIARRTAEAERNHYLQVTEQRDLTIGVYEKELKLRDDQHAEVTAERDKWQVEAAKRQAVIERQASDIIRLDTTIKTLQNAAAVRRSNRR